MQPSVLDFSQRHSFSSCWSSAATNTGSSDGQAEAGPSRQEEGSHMPLTESGIRMLMSVLV
jgi:hypothetical protein